MSQHSRARRPPLNTSGSISSEGGESLHFISPPLSRAGTSNLYNLDDKDFNVWVTDEVKQQNPLEGDFVGFSAPEFAWPGSLQKSSSSLSHSAGHLQYGGTYGGSSHDHGHDHDHGLGPGGGTIDFSTFNQYGLSRPPPISPTSYPLRLAGRKYLPGTNRTSQNMSPTSAHSRTKPRHQTHTWNAGDSDKNSHSQPSRNNNKSSGKHNSKSNTTEMEIHRSLFDVSPLQQASRATKYSHNKNTVSSSKDAKQQRKQQQQQQQQQQAHQKPTPYGPVWGREAYYRCPPKLMNVTGSKNLKGYRSGGLGGLESLGANEKRFHAHMSTKRVTRREIPTQKRRVLTRLNASKSTRGFTSLVESPFKAEAGRLNLSSSMDALQMERVHGLSLHEIKRSTEFVLKSPPDSLQFGPAMPHAGTRNGSERSTHSIGTFDGVRLPIETIEGLLEKNIEGEIFEELRQRQKSREMDSRMSEERQRLKSRADGRHRSVTPISVISGFHELRNGTVHTRMSRKFISQKRPSVVDIGVDFGISIDRLGENQQLAKGKPWSRGGH